MTLERRETQHRLNVCISCRSGDWRPGTPREGRVLFGLIASFLRSWPRREKLALYGVECLNNCARPCSLSLSAPGKGGYEFGDQRPTEEAAEAILDMAALYMESADGAVPASARPTLLEAGLIATYS